MFPNAHWELSVHDVRHAVAPLHAYGEQRVCVGCWQVPVPSHTAGFVATPLVHEPALQMVPAAANWNPHTPAVHVAT